MRHAAAATGAACATSGPAARYLALLADVPPGFSAGRIGKRVADGGVLEDEFQLEGERIQRTADVVQQAGEVGRQRPPAGILPGRHQVSRADFTAWMPYFASLL